MHNQAMIAIRWAALGLFLGTGCSREPAGVPDASGTPAGRALPGPAVGPTSPPVDLPRRGAVSVASIDLGTNPVMDGLKLVNLEGDGACAPAEVNGVPCHVIRAQRGQPPVYFYFQLAEGRKLRASEVFVVVEYYDATSGEMAVDYDSADELSRNPGYTRVPTRVALNNDRRWHKGIFVLREPRFQRTQHDGGDFRVALSGRQLHLRSVKLMQ